jgi:hypothetical protein
MGGLAQRPAKIDVLSFTEFSPDGFRTAAEVGGYY